MLYNGVNHFNWQVNNFSDLYPGNSAATQLTAGSGAHTKGTDTAVLSGIAHDAWGVYIMVSSGATVATSRRQMIDLLIDPAAGVGNAGSSWSVLINNLYTNSPVFGTSKHLGHNYYFPLFIPAGTAIGARTQDTVTDETCRFSIRLVGQPTRPDLVKVGHKVQTIGATTASTDGVSFTPGTSAVGTYSASMGTLTNDAWWWQVGFGVNDTTQTDRVTHLDVAHDATSKYICMRSVMCIVDSGENSSKNSFGEGSPIRHAPAGTDVYIRGHSAGAPDSNWTGVVYALS